MTPPTESVHLDKPLHPGRRVRDWVLLMRPKQWTKNAFVLAPLLFSGRAMERGSVASALLGFAAFCLAASAVYAFNDVNDRAEDQAHPTKRFRPVAAGRIGVGQARAMAAVLATVGVALAWQVGPGVAGWVALYLALNVLYSVVLKTVVLLDVFCIAAFFVLRLLTGSAAVGVKSSVWLLVCGGLLALYLGFAKRRHELTVLGDRAAGHRGVLAHYSAPFLDQISSVLLAVTIVAYLMYTLTSETARRVGSDALSYGSVFVLYGVFRYLYLVHRRDQGTPTETVLEDRPLLITVALWIAYSAWLIYRPR
ncbi:MAG: decaprenyl-phosphate phosphoribosyltransferase [Gemmatimonadaceae bacterium]|nr:decaprenyl-phosphate phosphoribosyltransferase [Gemmatimonadaceae bacterium]